MFTKNFYEGVRKKFTKCHVHHPKHFTWNSLTISRVSPKQFWNNKITSCVKQQLATASSTKPCFEDKEGCFQTTIKWKAYTNVNRYYH